MKQKINEVLKLLHLDHKQWKSMFVLTIIMNIIYCSLYSIVSLFSHSNMSLTLYTMIQYALYIILSVIYYLLFTQFIRNRNNDKEKIQWKSFLFPLVKLETVLFFIMEAISLMFFYSNLHVSFIRYICLILSVFMMIFYFPLRFYGYHQIYYQQKNPFMIIKNGFTKIMIHFQSIFYSWLTMAILFIGFHYLCTICNGPFFIQFTSITVQLLTLFNPFMFFFLLVQGLGILSILTTILTFMIGIILSLAMVYYFSFLIHIYDKENK